jgi:phosphate-selective porin OprO/OprP
MRKILTFFFAISLQSLIAQSLEHGKGIKYLAKDSSFSVKFNTRFQSLYEGTLNTKTNEWSDKLLTRRYRLKFGGFVYNPKFEYKIELALSNRDQGGISSRTNTGANIVLDAVVKWHFAKNWSFWMGQTKLPGNRERVISSQQLQFVDRSNLNSKFTIDRDKGIQIRHKHKVGKGVIKELASISLGQGRNITVDNAGGYDYTLRAEYLPFGEFQSKGDYFGSDLKRESEPKLSIGVTYDINKGASRTQGQLKDFLDVNSDLETVFIDAMFKYNGFSFMMEYADKIVKDGAISGLTDSGSTKYFYTGNALNFQTGYLFKNNFEVATRYTSVKPERSETGNNNQQYTLGVSKYISGHTFKVQSDLTLITEDSKDDQFRFRFQIEIGF